MSKLKVESIQHPESSTPAITLSASGGMSGSFPYPNRNLLYNGAMQVAQRGTSSTGITSSGYYTADRWVPLWNGAGSTWTQTVENDAPTGSGFRKSLKMLCTTASAAPTSELVRLTQILEGQDLQRIASGTSSAQNLTLSFWVKANVTGTFIVELYSLDTIRAVSASYSIVSSGTWEKKSITLPADTTGAFDNDNAGSLRVQFGLMAGSDYTGGTLATSWDSLTNANRYVGQTNLAAATNNYWQITGVQLETGDTATEFEFKSFGQELRECQRYYWKTEKTSTSTSDITAVFANGTVWTNSWQAFIQFPVTLRNTPVLSNSAASTFHFHVPGVMNNECTSLTYQATKDSMRIAGGISYTGTAGLSGQLCARNATAFIAASAEL